MTFAGKDENNKVSVSWINGMVLYHPQKLVEWSERMYEDQLFSTAQKIAQRSKECSILLLSGPSASSKTTTAGKISDYLEAQGVHSAVISLDDFFLNRDDLPILPNGEKDFESIHTLDHAELTRCFDTLLKTGTADFPIFDFTTGKRSPERRRITVNHDSMLVVEGIHALNPEITKRHDKNSFLKLYISPNSDYMLDDKRVLTAREIRLIRRIVRDHFHRNNPVDGTMHMWVEVVRSEIANIIPYKKEADFIVDSTILYEPAIWTHYLSSVLATDEVSAQYRAKIERLHEGLSAFVPLAETYLPEKTVLREFLA